MLVMFPIAALPALSLGLVSHWLAMASTTTRHNYANDLVSGPLWKDSVSPEERGHPIWAVA